MFAKKPHSYIPITSDLHALDPASASSSASLLYDPPPVDMIDLVPFRSSHSRRARGSSFPSKRAQIEESRKQIDAFISLTDARYHIPSPTSTVDSGESTTSGSGSAGYDAPEDDPEYEKRRKGGRVDGRKFFKKSREMVKIGEGYERAEQQEEVEEEEEEEEGEGGYYYGKPGDEEDGEFLMGNDKRYNRLKWPCFAFLVILITAWIGWALALLVLQTGNHDDGSSTHRLQLDDLHNKSFTPKRKLLVWVENSQQDGVFTYKDPVTRDIVLESVGDQSRNVFVLGDELTVDNLALNYFTYTISADSEFLLVGVNRSKLWRHSYFANYYVYNLASHALFPLTNYSTFRDVPSIAYAKWSPTGHSVAYVFHNDLYVTDLKNHTRVTFDGAPEIFNGVPDWVYEEEVFGTNFALWWSPDSTHVAYLRFNETEVPEYRFSRYVTGEAYPYDVVMKYPKPGYPNPTVTLHVYCLATFNSTLVNIAPPADGSTTYIPEFPAEDRLITQVAWATTTHSRLLYKQTNRIQDHEKTVLVSIFGEFAPTVEARVVREYAPSDNGWVDLAQNLRFIPPTAERPQLRYLDVVDDGNGFMHLALFDPIDAEEPSRFLTSGEWDVIDESVVVDATRGVVYYISTARSPLERHLYSVSIDSSDSPDTSALCITCDAGAKDAGTVPGFYSASFSPRTGFYVLNYEGPDVPYQQVMKVGDQDFVKALENNTILRDILEGYALPRKRMVKVMSGGVELNGVEILPPDFDASRKYPVLFRVYGGPGSQMVSHRFQLDWSSFVASNKGLSYIVVMVDGRGTGFKGRKFKVAVRGRLGELETIDQVNAGRHWASLDYVDPTRMAIWGWSYGGYMTSKVVEANDGVFTTAMAVAPVTDWIFYDSVYTERYMKTPQLNVEGYDVSAVRNVTGFGNVNFLLAHGTADDNVHFQNSAVLVDMLTQGSIRGYRTQFYTDNDHSINTDNANREIYHLLTTFLWESFGGEHFQRDQAEVRQFGHHHK